MKVKKIIKTNACLHAIAFALLLAAQLITIMKISKMKLNMKKPKQLIKKFQKMVRK